MTRDLSELAISEGRRDSGISEGKDSLAGLDAVMNVMILKAFINNCHLMIS